LFDIFHKASPSNLHYLSRLLGFGDVRGLLEEMKSISDGKSQEEVMENMSKGKFTLRDMYKQFQQVMKIGPLNKVMGMIPGMEHLIPNGDDESTNRLKKFLYMMDSMNSAELDGKIDLHTKNDPNVEKRIRRIAAGSGTHPAEVKLLLQTHKQFEGVVNKMGKSGMMGKGGARQKQMMEQMRKNPNAMMKQLQNNPQAMKMVCECATSIVLLFACKLTFHFS
jgi:signal recognition particle subunit SRP54